MTTFTLTEDHIKLLQRSYIEYDGYTETGGFEQDPKRPYGNSDVAGDVYEILEGEEWDTEEDMPDRLYESLMRTHKEVATALQIVLVTGKFETGTYQTTRMYDSRSWAKIEGTD